MLYPKDLVSAINRTNMMLFELLSMASLAAAVSLQPRQSGGYVIPQSGMASVTQFVVTSEFGTGTSCGVYSLANGNKKELGRGAGPGELYVCGVLSQIVFLR